MRSLLQRFGRDQRGVAAMEFAAVGTVFLIGALNAIDVGRYAYETSEVNAAAQAGAQAAFVACDANHTPATLNCKGLNDAVTTAIQSTGLGSNVQLGAIAEGYYCLDTGGLLQTAGTATAKPSDCSAIQNAASGATPTLYIQVQATYAFQPLFPGLTLAAQFAPSIARTTWMRMA
jgi:Flp pilus assembly protein TadG